MTTPNYPSSWIPNRGEYDADQPLYDDLGEGNFIRLLKLNQVTSSDVYRLETFRLSDCPEYYALSYCWGSPEREDSIHCNASRLAISTHLKLGLQELESIPSLAGHWFWVDQICVNQDDLAERTHQVQLMKRIYSRASSTVVWLGVSDGPCEGGFRLAQEIFKIGQSDEASRVPPYCTARIPREDRLRSEGDVVSLGLPPLKEPVWAELSTILSRPWFTRLWVLQEAILSRTPPILVYSQGLRSYESVFFALMFLCQMNAVMNASFSAKHLACGLLMFLLRHRTREWDLASLLIGTREFHVTDARDTVFALLSLASETSESKADEWPEALTPNYEKTLEVVYRDVTRQLITSNKSLGVMCLCGNDPDGLTPTHPSWVPSFHASGPLFGSGFERGHQTASGIGKRLGYASRSQHAIVQQGTDDNILSVLGLKIDKITWRSDCAPSRQRLFTWCDEGAEQLKIPIDSKPAVYAYVNMFLRLSSFSVLFNQTPAFWHFVDYLLKFRTVPMPYLDNFLKETAFNDPMVALPSNLADLDELFEMNSEKPILQLFVTENGVLGVGPKYMREGDFVVVLFGNGMPFVVRPTEEDDYQLLGECFVESLMEGQAVTEWRKKERTATWFSLR